MKLLGAKECPPKFAPVLGTARVGCYRPDSVPDNEPQLREMLIFLENTSNGRFLNGSSGCVIDSY